MLTGMLGSPVLQIDQYFNLHIDHIHVSTTYATLAGVVVIELDKARFDTLMEGGDTDPYGKYPPSIESQYHARSLTVILGKSCCHGG